MNILYGYYQPSKGHLYWKGQEVKIEDSLKAQQLGISMVHQEGMLLQQMDVTSNIFLSQMDATAGFIHAKRMQQKAKKALEALGISHISPNSMVYDLSAADQKMVEIAKALSMQPRLLLLDEPTASLTEREIKMLFQTIRLLKQEGVAILYISHRLEEIFQIADSVTILRDGQHIISGDIQEFTMDSVILNMVGHSLSEQLEQLQQNRKDFSGGEVTISVEGLSKKGKFQNISFSARKGEIFGISRSGWCWAYRIARGNIRLCPGGLRSCKNQRQRCANEKLLRSTEKGLGPDPRGAPAEGLIPAAIGSVQHQYCCPEEIQEISAASRQANGSGCS